MKIKVMKHPMIPITLFLANGIIFSNTLQEVFSFTLWLCVVGILFVAGVWCFLKMRHYVSSLYNTLFWGITCLFFFFFGGVMDQLHTEKPPSTSPGYLIAKVTIDEVLKSNTNHHRYYATFTSDNFKQKILVYQPASSKSLWVGDRVQGVLNIQLVAPPKNPFQFDYSDYLQRKNIFYQTYLPTVYDQLPPQKNINYYVALWRRGLLSKLQELPFSKDVQGIVSALLMGQKNELSSEIEANYRNTGVIHVLAISGLHVGVLYGFLYFLFSQFRMRKKAVVWLSILFLMFFALFTGLSGSVVRAVVMFSLVGVGSLSYQKTQTIHLLAISMFCILVLAPSFLFDVSFQLSYAAVFSIVWLYPSVQQKVTQLPKYLQPVASLLGVSLVAQIGVLPLSLYYFGQIPMLFLFGNLIVIPVMTVVLILLFVLLPFLFISKTISIVLAWTVNFLIEFCNQWISFLAALPSNVIKDVNIGVFQALLASIVVLLLGLLLQKYSYQRLLLFLMSILAVQLSFIGALWESRQQQELVFFYDKTRVVLLENRNGQAQLFSNQPLNELPQYVRDYAIKRRVDVKDATLIRHYVPVSKAIEIIDSTGVYMSKPTDVVVLYHNPNFDFEQFIQKNNPSLVVFHPDNAKWRILYWSQMCETYKIPYHNMRDKGFLRVALK